MNDPYVMTSSVAWSALSDIPLSLIWVASLNVEPNINLPHLQDSWLLSVSNFPMSHKYLFAQSLELALALQDTWRATEHPWHITLQAGYAENLLRERAFFPERHTHRCLEGRTSLCTHRVFPAFTAVAFESAFLEPAFIVQDYALFWSSRGGNIKLYGTC